MPKKKFKDTKVGGFLSRNGSAIIDAIGESIPDKGLLGVAKNLITKDKYMTDDEKDTALELLKLDEDETANITTRWEVDAMSDNKLTKLVRPLIIIYLTLMVTVCAILDSMGYFAMKDSWITLLEALLLAVYVAYFGSRGFEKYAKIKSNK